MLELEEESLKMMSGRRSEDFMELALVMKLVNMIDFVMMKRDQQQLCTDVRVYRSASCWTDHYLVKGKLILSFSRKQRNSVT